MTFLKELYEDQDDEDLYEDDDDALPPPQVRVPPASQRLRAGRAQKREARMRRRGEKAQNEQPLHAPYEDEEEPYYEPAVNDDHDDPYEQQAYQEDPQDNRDERYYQENEEERAFHPSRPLARTPVTTYSTSKQRRSQVPPSTLPRLRKSMSIAGRYSTQKRQPLSMNYQEQYQEEYEGPPPAAVFRERNYSPLPQARYAPSPRKMYPPPSRVEPVGYLSPRQGRYEEPENFEVEEYIEQENPLPPPSRRKSYFEPSVYEQDKPM